MTGGADGVRTVPARWVSHLRITDADQEGRLTTDLTNPRRPAPLLRAMVTARI